MTLEYVFNKVNQAMILIQNIEFMNESKPMKAYNQKKIHEVYRLLDDFKDELIRERIKNKQKADRKDGRNT